jgi:hypothetical protein
MWALPRHGGSKQLGTGLMKAIKKARPLSAWSNVKAKGALDVELSCRTHTRRERDDQGEDRRTRWHHPCGTKAEASAKAADLLEPALMGFIISREDAPLRNPQMADRLFRRRCSAA